MATFDFKGNFGGAVTGWTTVSALNGSLINYEGNTNFFVDTTGETDVPPDDVFKSFLYVVPAGDPLNFKKTGLTPNEFYDFYLYLWHNNGFWSGHTGNVTINGTSVGSYVYDSAVPGQGSQSGHGKVVKLSGVQANSSGELNVSVDPDGTNYAGISGYRIKGLPDTTPPSKVTGLSVDNNRNVTSNPATDNSGTVAGYQTQYADDNGAWIQFASNALNFQDNVARSSVVGDHTRKYRRRAYDAADVPNYGDWSDVFTVNYTVLPPPIFVSTSPLLYAQTGKLYSTQIEVNDPFGSGSFEFVFGNLPNGAMDEDGLINIANAGAVDYTFGVRYISTNGAIVQETFTIPVSEYAYRQLEYVRPLKRNPILTITEFPVLAGTTDVAEDAPLKYEYELTCMGSGQQEVKDLEKFFEDHRLREPFLWYDADWDELRTVYLVSSFPSERRLNYGGVQVTLKDV